jgi:dihydrolipoamide dehydrogenase
LKRARTETLKAKDIIIATGAHTFTIPGVELDGEKIIDYETAILRDTLPESAVIIGGGAIGVEFATIWNAYGVEVTIIEMLETLLPLEDEAVGKEIEKAYKKRGINVMTGSKVKGVKAGKAGTTVTVEGKDGEETIEAALTLVAIGFKPNSQGLGWKRSGLS